MASFEDREREDQPGLGSRSEMGRSNASESGSSAPGRESSPERGSPGRREKIPGEDLETSEPAESGASGLDAGGGSSARRRPVSVEGRRSESL